MVKMDKLQFIGFVKGVPSYQGSHDYGLDFLIKATQSNGEFYAHFRLENVALSEYLVRGVYESILGYEIPIKIYQQALIAYNQDPSEGMELINHNLKLRWKYVTISELVDQNQYEGYDQENGYVVLESPFR